MRGATTLDLIAAILGAAGLFSAPAARAASIQCNITNLSGPEGINIWPYSARVRACTGTSRLVGVQNGLWAVVHEYDRVVDGKEVGKGPQLQSYAPQVFLFNKPADYISFFGTNCPSLIEKPGQTPPAGETFFNAKCSVTGNQPYTVVFENFGTYPNLQINFFVDLTAAHEMGHWFDLVILGTPPGQPATAKLFSSSDIWTHEMNVSGQNTKGAKGDYPVFNALQFACSGYDVFNGLKDNHTPSNWICANSGRGPSLNKGPGANYSGSNINVLNAAVPHPPIYLNPAELFAEEAAVDTGDVGTEQTVDSYLKRNAQWYCTQTLVKSMLSYGAPPGTPPSPYPLPSTLPPSEPGAMCPDK